LRATRENGANAVNAPSTFEERINEIRKLVCELDTECAEMRQGQVLQGPAASFFTPEQFEVMSRVASKALLLAVLMIHRSGQGHIASTASALHIMVAIYFSHALDFLRYARGESNTVFRQCESQKPHAVPGWYGLLYLEGVLDLDQIQAFRTFQGPCAYPTHEDPGIQIPTGSLGLGPVAAIGLAVLDEYNANHGGNQERALQLSIIGDSEFDEGVIHESIKERATHGITRWIEFIDYNRQSLDGNLDERLVDRITGLYESYGIPVIILKYGSRLQELFNARRGGAEMRRRLDALSTDDYQALLRTDGRVIRRIMTLDTRDFEVFLREGTRRIEDFFKEIENGGSRPDPDLKNLLCSHTDQQVKDVFGNLGGHDLPMLIGCIQRIKEQGGAAAVIAYTVKGWGIEPLIGSLSGHWKKLSSHELQDFLDWLGIDLSNGASAWDRFPEDDPVSDLFSRIARARQAYESALDQECRDSRARLCQIITDREGGDLIPDELPRPAAFDLHRPTNTQNWLGELFGELSRVDENHPLAPIVDRTVTMAADVAYTAGLKEWVNTRGVWGPPAMVDVIRKYGESPEMNVQPRRDGQHLRLSNLEQFLGLLAAAFGKSADLIGERRFPFAFFYDVFLERFAEMFKYAAYWDAAVWYVGTIAGCSAPGESGLHHGSMSAIIGRMTPNVITWEPTFPLELNWILAEEFRRAIFGRDQGRRVRYLRTTATPVRQDLMAQCLMAQPRFAGMTEEEVYTAIRPHVLAGGYRLVDRQEQKGYDPAENVVNIFATGVSVHDAISASNALAEKGVFANVMVVTSPDLLIDQETNKHILQLVTKEEKTRMVPVLSVTDSQPSFLSGISHRLRVTREQPLDATLGVTEFDRSGTDQDVKSLHGISSEAIAATADELLGV